MSPSSTRREQTLPELPKDTPHICVSVIGMPSYDLRTSTTGLGTGVGKSCLCSRFVLSSVDDYDATKEYHLSTVPQKFFTGREQNGQHFLYHGSVVKRPWPSRQLAVFHVVEHTTVVDDASFTPHPGHEHYAVRSTSAALSPSGKVAYLGRRFIGQQLDKRERFPPMFDGERHCVGGYVLVLDPTRDEGELNAQLDLLRSALDRINLQRNPFRLALAITKCDVVSAEEVCSVRQKATDRLGDISCFEVSARSGVGVDGPFHFVYNAITFGAAALPTVLVPYATSAIARASAERLAEDRLRKTLGEHVTKFETSFSEMTHLLVSHGQGEALAAVLSLKGRSRCKELFRERLIEVKVDALQKALKQELNTALLSHPDIGEELDDAHHTG